MLHLGRILQFDEARGYGFIAPDGGGADVFVHANECEGDEARYTAGTRVEFEVMDGGRGKKAYAVRVVDEAEPAASARAQSVVAAAAPAKKVPSGEDDGMCDVLTSEELRIELTELFITSAPDLTGAQITRLRGELLLLARKHGWVEE